jgi:urease accessory protein
VLHALAGDRVDAPPTTGNSPVHQLTLHFDGALRVLRQDPPWKVVRAFGPLVHIHNVSGGVLAGDHLALDATIAGHAQITTTGATRLYRHRAGALDSQQHVRFLIGENATLEYLPDPLIPFAGSRHKQRTSITLERGATFIWWEVLARTFALERLQISTSIDVLNKPALREDYLLEPARRPVDSIARMAKSSHLASFYVLKEGETRWRELEEALRNTVPDHWGVSTLAAGGVIARALADTGRHFTAELNALRNTASMFLTGQPAVPPRKVY